MSTTKRDERSQRYHNEGQEDAAKGYGNYDPPHGLFHTIISRDADKDNKSYTTGYRHGVEQREKSKK